MHCSKWQSVAYLPIQQYKSVDKCASHNRSKTDSYFAHVIVAGCRCCHMKLITVCNALVAARSVKNHSGIVAYLVALDKLQKLNFSFGASYTAVRYTMTAESYFGNFGSHTPCTLSDGNYGKWIRDLWFTYISIGLIMNGMEASPMAVVVHFLTPIGRLVCLASA